jgi:tripartite-type tricarboxylate transporter receptor subunit TctC/DNA-binding MarR family transcriptional regulator
MPHQGALEKRYPWARIASSADTIVPHRVPFPLARRFAQICTTVVAEAYAGEELRTMEYAALACLDDFPGIDQRQLARLMGVDRTNVGQIVEELEARGLIDRRVNGDDRRARELRATARGQKLRRDLRPKLLAAQAGVLAPLTLKEQCQVIDLLARVVEANEVHARPGAGRRRPQRKAAGTNQGGPHDQERMSSVSRGGNRPSRRACAAIAAIAPAKGANWPERSVRILTTAPSGSSSDAVARTLADTLAKRWNRPVIVENRPGADGIIAAQGFVEARDGHTLLFTTHSTLTVNPILHENLPYDPIRDFAPVALAVEDFLCIVAAPTLPANSLRELVDHARTKPGELNAYAVPGSPSLSMLAFEKRAGIKMTFVNYRNAGQAITDLGEGRIDVALVPLALVLGQAAAGKVKLLAVTNVERSPAAAAVPTVAEAGYPDLTFGGLLGVFGSRDMPPVVRERLSAEVREILTEPQIRQRLTNVGVLIRGSSPAEFTMILDEQRAKWAAIARAHDIKPKSKATP